MCKYLIFDQNGLLNIIRQKKLQSPCYIYDKKLLNTSLQQAQDALSQHFKKGRIHYAVKANHNADILNVVKQYSIGVDCVSGGEIQRVLDEGFDASDIVFAGVGKADWEIKLALSQNIFAFNCESLEEISVINTFAKEMGKKARICLRVNPNIEAKTHRYISTGRFNDKFGMSFPSILKWLEGEYVCLEAVEFVGLHYHIGSQIRDMTVFESLASTVEQHIKALESKNINVQHVNFGGGLGVNYAAPQGEPSVDFNEYFRIFSQVKLGEDIEVHFELGRSLVAQCGILVTQVLFVNQRLKLTPNQRRILTPLRRAI